MFILDLLEIDKMEETWFLMKGKPHWTFEYMIRDADYYHESIKNNGNPSAGVNIKEEDQDLPIEVKEEGDGCDVQQEMEIKEEENGSPHRVKYGEYLRKISCCTTLALSEM